MESKKKSHSAIFGDKNITGTTITATPNKRVSGKTISLSLTMARLNLTSSLADLSACIGVISGKVTMYTANNDEQTMYTDSSRSINIRTNHKDFSKAVTASPPEKKLPNYLQNIAQK